MKRVLFAFVLVFVAIGASAISTPPARAASSSLNWTSCGRGFDCSTLSVPIDYSNPNGGNLSLALIRLPATDQAHKVGSLLVNPGGPGASGVNFVRAWANSLSPTIRQQFDIVGFDPRGIGQSSPIVCHDNLQAFVAANPVPTTQAEWDKLVQLTKDFDNACAQKYGSLLPYLGTKNVARDMDQIRAAVGDDKLTYLGYSYGTVIGQVYAELFPTKIRAMVLDGAVDLSLPVDDKTLTQIGGFELALNDFVKSCQQQNCVLNVRTNGNPMSAIDQLLAKVKQAPIPAPGADRPAGPGETFLGLIAPLYSKSAWPLLGTAVDSALNGDGTAIVRLADSYLERNPDGSYPNDTEANLAVSCVDEEPSKLPTQFKDFPPAEAKFAQTSPHFGAAVANGLTCAFWPAKPDPLSAPTNVSGTPPILVVDTTGDPATPYAWGQAVAKEIKGAVLLTNNGEGHTAYDSGDACIDGDVNTYLLNVQPPPAGTECGTKIVTPGSSPTPGAPATGDEQGSNTSPTPASIQAQPAARTSANNSVRDIVVVVMVIAAGFAVVVMVINYRQRRM